MYKVGKPIVLSKMCPVCQKWLEPRHIICIEADTLVERVGFVKSYEGNFWHCKECNSRFEVK